MKTAESLKDSNSSIEKNQIKENCKMTNTCTWLPLTCTSWDEMITKSFNFLLNNLVRDMTYHVRANFGFNTDDQGNAQIYIVVYDNAPIFGRWLLGMATNVCNGSLKTLLRKKTFSVYQVLDFFKGSMKNMP